MLYNEQNRNGRWYNGQSMNESESGSWYEAEASAEPAAENALPEETQSQNTGYFIPDGNAPYAARPVSHRPAKGVHPAWRVIAIVALCLLAINLLLVFVLGLCVSFMTDGDVSESSFSFSYDGDADTPFFFGEDDSGEDLIPEDADIYEYFDAYFSGDSDINIQRAEPDGSVTLEFADGNAKEKSLQDIYADVSPCIVGITTYSDDMEWGWGSGVIFTADGYIVTNTHIIEGADAATVITTDGTEYEAEYVGSDNTTDIAVLKIDGKNLPCAEFADSSSCLVGDDAIAIGNPLSSQYSGTMTTGIISGIDRSVDNNGFSMTMLQTNAALNEGNSGGALLNSCGQVIGITNMKIMFTYDATVEGIGFAIPSAVFKPVVDAILEYGYVPGQPTLGIMAGSVSYEAMERYDLPEGIYVSEVNENSDAYARGLQVGDVITAVNDIPVSSVDEVNAIKSGYAVGDTITCTVYREGKTFDITFALVDKSQVE